MAIVVGDIHGDLALAKAFLSFRPDQEHVALGDFVDSRDPQTTFEQELACLDLLLGSTAILIWGNHDLAYTREQPWPCHTRFGDTARAAFESSYQAARLCGSLTPVHATADGWLCSHAGISTALTAALPDCPWGGSPSAVASWIVEEFDREFATPRRRQSTAPEGLLGEGPLFSIDWIRGGHDGFGGIFWYDERWETETPPDPRLRQVFGHTRIEGPMSKGAHVNIHIADGWWVFDTKTEELVRLER